MPFDSASREIDALIRAGVDSYIDGLRATGMSDDEIIRRLPQIFGGGGIIHPNQARSLVERNRANRNAGNRLNRRRSNNPLSDDEHVGTAIPRGTYQYETVVIIREIDSGNERSMPVVVQSNEPLGKEDIVQRALAAIIDLIERRKIGAYRGKGPEFELVKGPRITGASRGHRVR